MLDQIKEKIEGLEILASNFISTKNGSIYMKEKITELTKTGTNLPLSFEFLIVAMSRNGGLIATCKTTDYYDQSKTRINNNILVMHQNAAKRYYIPIDWKYKTSYIVNLEFNSKEQLYGFCSNGDIRKIDTLTESAIVKTNSAKFFEEGIAKAKLFDKGFIGLTNKGNIYYAPDIKDPKPTLILNIKEKYNMSDKVDFLGIPAGNSASGKAEILIIGDNVPGIIHAVGSSEEKGFGGLPMLEKKNIEVNMINLESTGEETQAKDMWEISEGDTGEKKGFDAMCISPNNEEVAFYSGKNSTLYICSSELRKSEMKKIKLSVNKIQLETMDSELTKEELEEHESLFAFDNKHYQFMFVGSSAVALCSKRFLVLVTKDEDIISFRIAEENSKNSLSNGPLFKCVSEVDGIRTYSKEGIYLISEVSKDLINVCDPFSKHPSKNLLNAYGYYLSKNADCDKIIHDIAAALPESINTLQKAAMNIFFMEDDEETSNLKELQMLLIKAAQYGKSFVQKGDFNYETYVSRCKDIRIINSLRNLKTTPRFLTYEEYNDMNLLSPDDFMKMIMRYHDYKFAFELNNYLGYENEKIYLQFCIANIRRLSDDNKAEQLFKEFNDKLIDCPNISFITLAKKCIKHRKYKLAEKFLEQEKSIVVKVPQYLQLKNWNKALDLAIESNDRTVIKVVIDKIFKVEQKNHFIKIVGSKPKAHRAVIEYLKMHELTEELKNYLISKKDYEELLFINLENFFKCKSLDGRKKFIEEANEYVKDMKGMPNFDFYKNYLKDLKYSLKFKKMCIEKDYIAPNDISPFDNSIFDCYKSGIDKDKDYKCIEEGNKQFNIGQKKINYIKFKRWAETNRFEKIDNEINNVGYKKLDITPLIVAKILFSVNNYEKAVKYIKEVNDINDFEEKINLMKKMKKYEEAVEIIMKDKKVDKEEYLNGILREKPELKSFIDNFGKK